MNREQVMKRFEKLKKEHDKNEQKTVLRAKKEKWEYTAKPFQFELKYYSKLHIFKASNVWFEPETLEARSYNWWTFVRKYKNQIVFNNYYYSMQTNKHQWKTKSLLKQLGIKTVEVNIYGGLQKLESEALLETYQNLFKNEIAMINGRAGTYRQKARISRARELKKQIKTLNSLGLKFSQKKIKEIKDVYYKAEADRLAKIKADKEFVKSALNNAELFKVA